MYKNSLILYLFALEMFVICVAPGWADVAKKLSPTVTIYLSSDLVVFDSKKQISGIIEAGYPVRVFTVSDSDTWSISYQASPLISKKSKISPKRIQIKTPYSNGYKGLNIQQEAAKGLKTGSRQIELAKLEFRVMITPNDKPGIYTGTIYSHDGAPIIHVRLIIEKGDIPKVTRRLRRRLI